MSMLEKFESYVIAELLNDDTEAGQMRSNNQPLALDLTHNMADSREII